MARGIWLLIAVAAIAGALVFWKYRGARRNTNPPSAAPAAAVVPDAVTLSGRIQARSVTPVGAPVEGTVEEFLADVGDEVFEGQLLARISNTGFETAHEKARIEAERASLRLTRLEGELTAARLEASRASADRSRARTELERTRRVHQRQKVLHSEGATPRLTYERAEREFTATEADSKTIDEVAKIAEERVASIIKDIDAARRILDDKNRSLEDAQAQLDSEQVLAPVDGLIVGRRGAPGDAVNPDVKDLFQIAVDLGQLSVTLTPEPNVARILHPGMPAIIQIAELGGEALPGTITSITGANVTVEFTSPTPVIKPGMTASVRINIR
jgi:multidrug efflux pump subunit AcrA (membrane-fusion protein)